MCVVFLCAGDLAGQDKVSAFFATEEADQVLKCFDKIDSAGAGTVSVADVLASRNAPTEEDGTGLVPRCGTFTLSQAAIEGVFACCGTSDTMDLSNFARLFHAYVYPHAPSATRFWFDVIGTPAHHHAPGLAWKQTSVAKHSVGIMLIPCLSVGCCRH